MKRLEQKELRKKDILIKSMNLFVTKGYHETKITDIAKSVDMSAGLLFHYFASKEELYYELVKIGVQESKRPEELQTLPPLKYFEETIKRLFKYSKEEPWVFQMFILMNQATKEGMPKKIKELANEVNQIEFSAEIIKQGQEEGVIKEGDPYLLSTCFWASIQGIMECLSSKKEINMPNPDWILSIIKK